MAQQIEQLGGEAIVVGANLGKVRRGCVCCCLLQQLLAGWRQVWLRVGLESRAQAHCAVMCATMSAPTAAGRWHKDPLPALDHFPTVPSLVGIWALSSCSPPNHGMHGYSVSPSHAAPNKKHCAVTPQREDIERLFKEVTDKWGTVNVLVNNAVRGPLAAAGLSGSCCLAVRLLSRGSWHPLATPECRCMARTRAGLCRVQPVLQPGRKAAMLPRPDLHGAACDSLMMHTEPQLLYCQLALCCC